VQAPSLSSTLDTITFTAEGMPLVIGQATHSKMLSASFLADLQEDYELYGKGIFESNRIVVVAVGVHCVMLAVAEADFIVAASQGLHRVIVCAVAEGDFMVAAKSL
jgi:hypothetical protein